MSWLEPLQQKEREHCRERIGQVKTWRQEAARELEGSQVVREHVEGQRRDRGCTKHPEILEEQQDNTHHRGGEKGR